MNHFSELLYRKSIASAIREGIEREAGERLFIEWRDRYIAGMCNHIRLCREAKQAGISITPYPPSPEWCNAAVDVLVHGDLMIQDYFLRSDFDTKDEMVQAVMRDKGFTNQLGRYTELPPL